MGTAMIFSRRGSPAHPPNLTPPHNPSITGQAELYDICDTVNTTTLSSPSTRPSSTPATALPTPANARPSPTPSARNPSASSSSTCMPTSPPSRNNGAASPTPRKTRREATLMWTECSGSTTSRLTSLATWRSAPRSACWKPRRTRPRCSARPPPP